MDYLKLTNPGQTAEMELFQAVAERIYQDDPVWAPGSEMMWRQRFQLLHPAPGAFVLPLVAFHAAQPVARCMLQLVPGSMDEQGRPQAWIGFFECQPGFQDTGRAMLAHGEAILAQWGAKSVLISKADNQLVGILAAGFEQPHTVFTNYNPPFYFDLLKSCGYLPKTRMLTLYFTRQNARRFSLRLPGLRTRTFDRRNLEQEILTFHTLQDQIFRERTGYVPRTYAEDDQLVRSFLAFLEDELVIIAETTAGKPVGLLLCLPDLYQRMRGEAISRARIISIGAIPGYTNKGVGALMGTHLLKNLLDNPRYTWVEGSWILSHNVAPQNLARRFNASPGKEYWLLEKKL